MSRCTHTVSSSSSTSSSLGSSRISVPVPPTYHVWSIRKQGWPAYDADNVLHSTWKYAVREAILTAQTSRKAALRCVDARAGKHNKFTLPYLQTTPSKWRKWISTSAWTTGYGENDVAEACLARLYASTRHGAGQVVQLIHDLHCTDGQRWKLVYVDFDRRGIGNVSHISHIYVVVKREELPLCIEQCATVSLPASNHPRGYTRNTLTSPAKHMHHQNIPSLKSSGDCITRESSIELSSRHNDDASHRSGPEVALLTHRMPAETLDEPSADSRNEVPINRKACTEETCELESLGLKKSHSSMQTNNDTAGMMCDVMSDMSIRSSRELGKASVEMGFGDRSDESQANQLCVHTGDSSPNEDAEQSVSRLTITTTPTLTVDEQGSEQNCKCSPSKHDAEALESEGTSECSMTNKTSSSSLSKTVSKSSANSEIRNSTALKSDGLTSLKRTTTWDSRQGDSKRERGKNRKSCECRQCSVKAFHWYTCNDNWERRRCIAPYPV